MRKILIAAATLMLSVSAYAVPYSELGDTGELPADAQGLPAGTTSILGTIVNADNDRDMYSFTWDGGLFEAEVTSYDSDSQLFLFDAAGMLIAENDDGGVGLLSLLSINLAAGDYFLAISDFNDDPLLDGSGVITGWIDGSGVGEGAYEITLNAATGGGTMPAPEPGILMLLGLGLAGLGFARRRS